MQYGPKLKKSWNMHKSYRGRPNPVHTVFLCLIAATVNGIGMPKGHGSCIWTLVRTKISIILI